jgi:hypothetical protein
MARYEVLEHIANHGPGDVVEWADDESGVNVERMVRNGRVRRLEEPKPEPAPAPAARETPPATKRPPTRKH